MPRPVRAEALSDANHLVHRSYVKKFLFYTINNLKLVQFRFSYVIKADKKQKWKLKISNA